MLVINDIFDLDDFNILFLYCWVNFFYIKMKEKIIYNEVVFFIKKCDVS